MRNILYIIPIILLGCTAKPHSGIISKPADGQYAQGFTLCRNAEYTEIVIFDPWEEGRIMQKYYLAGNTALIPHDDGIKVKVPLHSLAATSCTHVGFLDAIGETHSLCGICSPYLVYTPIPTVEEGCADLGDAMQVNPERVILTHPDAVMISTYAQGDGVRQYFEKSSIPVIYNNEWTEQSPLARAEWIRLIGAFYDKQDYADSLFREIENEYLTLRNKVEQSVIKKRTLMAGNNFRGTWYMPSGKVYTGQLYRDAGASYFYENDSTNGSIPLTFETVLLNFKDADVWVNSTAQSLDELREMDDKHTWFKAYQTGEVYNFLRRSTKTGANDFWESAVVHPERLLKDLVWTLYPELMPDYEPYYTEKLKQTLSAP
ncbi:MAG: ABC transporter substrate-binding protein [Paludibacteraceae bacterium]|nr:ABC transporter substrate-binding protein [Paludibacteraceae bacterium]